MNARPKTALLGAMFVIFLSAPEDRRGRLCMLAERLESVGLSVLTPWNEERR
jgi:hypothetical protein